MSSDHGQRGELERTLGLPEAADVDLSACDIIVLGESKQTTRERFLGRIHECIVRESDCPVKVVLRQEGDGEG